MSQQFRLPEGGSIDRSEMLSFRFNGRAYSGYAGDSLASALLANGIHFVGRSFKYHRPRGIYSAGEEEPNALLQIGLGQHREPSCRAPQVPLTDGIFAHSQNGWPRLTLDLGRLIDFTHWLWPAGFYNKTFKWPDWNTWERMVRHFGGKGRPLHDPDPDHYEQVNAHCDLLVCGGGPAGLMAALVAARAGLRVIIADQDQQFGGILNWEQIELDGREPQEWISEVVTELQSLQRVLTLPHTTVTGVYDSNVTTLLQRGENSHWRECIWTIRPKRVIVATGAIEQGLIFADNDRPGIMLAGAIRHYLNRYAVAAGRQAVIATNNDTAYQTAIDLCLRGIRVNAVVDSRSEVAEDLKQRIDSLGVRLYTGARIHNTRGARRIKSVGIASATGSALARVSCDLLGVSGGWAARVHLLCHARGTLRFDDRTQSFLAKRLPDGFRVMGSAAGIMDLNETFAEAAAGAENLCQGLGFRAFHVHHPKVTQNIISTRRAKRTVPQPAKRRQWIDLAHDVTLGDAVLAVREGYDAVEHFKRYTTTGMSVDQGKSANLNALLALAEITGRNIDEIGTTTFRPPYSPVTLGAIAGRNLDEFYAPRRYLPAHRIHQRLNAVLEDHAGWQRPAYYLLSGESEKTAIHRETRDVREKVGIFDNSPIGKIEVRGPDAAEFLNRMYITNVHTLSIGRSRYGLMLNESGVVVDDGVISRMSENHFLVNTTSGGVGHVLAAFEEWRQCEWPDLRVLVDDVTTQWANFTIAGPNARSLLQKLGTTIELAPDEFPHMAVTGGELGDETVRLLRVSFSGELSFEVNLRAGRANHFFAKILQAGREFGLTPYGIEALMILRLEKGYLQVGVDTDGETTPDDVGWGPQALGKSSDYLGRRSLRRTANTDPNRKQLVGLVAKVRSQVIRPGGHLLLGEEPRVPANTDGWITSAAFSPNLKRYIALAMLRAGRNMAGRLLTVVDESQRYSVRVVKPPFWDHMDSRMKQ